MARMADEIIAKAISYLGAAEPNGDDQFITYYNNLTGSNFNMSTPWCAIFVTVVARQVNAPISLVPTYAGCDAGVSAFKKAGRYEIAKGYGGTYTPQKGDVIFFSDGHNQNDSTHTGYVVSVSGSTIKTIEGNMSDKVGYRTIDASNKYIIGYGRVRDFDGSGTLQPAQNMISTFQTWLNSNYASGLTVDGAFGPKTKTAAIKAYQKVLGVTADGSFGPNTKAAVTTLKVGSSGNAVYLLQGMLYCHGYNPSGFDGVFGSDCRDAVIRFQSNNSLDADGYAGPNTMYVLYNK